MKVSVVHDEHGRIIAMSKNVDLKQAGSKFVRVGMVPGPGQRLLEIELSGEHEKKPLRELHNEYRVDIITSRLVKKD